MGGTKGGQALQPGCGAQLDQPLAPGDTPTRADSGTWDTWAFGLPLAACGRAPWGHWESPSRPDSKLGGHFCVSKHRSQSRAATVLGSPDKEEPVVLCEASRGPPCPRHPKKQSREKGAACWKGRRAGGVAAGAVVQLPRPWLSPRLALRWEGRVCTRSCHRPAAEAGSQRGTRMWRECVASSLRLGRVPRLPSP